MQDWQPIISWIGRIAGPIVALLVYWLLPGGDGGLSHSGRAIAGCGALMAVWWMSEAWPMAVTSLLPLVLFPLTGVYALDPQPGDIVQVKGEKRPAILVAVAPAQAGQPATATVDLVGVETERRTVPRNKVDLPPSMKPLARCAAPYANKYVFLYLAGFLLAFALERWNLHRRVALYIMQVVGTRPALLVGGVMVSTAFVSMWISNTATAAMMLPLGISLAALFDDRLKGPDQVEQGPSEDSRHFATALMLGIAYAATIGGMATIVGTPTNTFAVGFLRDHGIEVQFVDWLWIGLPVAVIFLGFAWWLLTFVLFPVSVSSLPDGERVIREELELLGPMTRGEITVAIVFVTTAILWFVYAPLLAATPLKEWFPTLRTVDDVLIGIAGALSLFFIPVNWEEGEFALDWDAAKRLPWDVLLLLGGGFALADGIEATGLDVWAGGHLGGLTWHPLLIVAVVSLAVVYLSELASNVATCIAVLPIAWTVAGQLGIPPVVMAVSVTLAASCGFMLPVATPPNAIAFGTGRVKVFEMIKAGFWLNLVGIAIVLVVTLTLAPWVFPQPAR